MPHRRGKGASTPIVADGAVEPMYAKLLEEFGQLELEEVVLVKPIVDEYERARRGAAHAADQTGLDSQTVCVFSFSTKKALWELLKDEVEKGLHADFIDADGTFRVPSQPYFNKLLRSFPNVRFHKQSSFTKCDTCVFTRNLIASRHGANFRALVNKARKLHLRHVASEVTFCRVAFQKHFKQ